MLLLEETLFVAVLAFEGMHKDEISGGSYMGSGICLNPHCYIHRIRDTCVINAHFPLP